MTIQVEFWHLVGLALTIGGMFAAISQRLAESVAKSLDLKFQHVEQLIKRLAELGEKNSADVHRLELDLAALRVEANDKYARREDHTAGLARIGVQIDNMSLRIEKALTGKGKSE